MEEPDFDSEYLAVQSKYQRYARLTRHRMRYALIAFVVALSPVVVLVLATKGLSVAFPSVDPGWLLLAVAIPESAVLYGIALWRKRSA